ncbi:MAG: peptidase domain-containing ABC transporter [bacterium]|nr:peptidase domain-containing ABC transporter [bacterium]
MVKYPLIRQHGMKDCGVSCLMMIISYYGGKVSREYLLTLTNTNKEGVDAFSLLKAAEKLNFSTKGVKGDFQQLKKEDFPCISHVVIEENYQHFIVIYRINNKKKQLVVADPAAGLKKISYNEFKKISTDEYLLLYPEKKIPKLTDTESFTDLIRLFIKDKYRIFIALSIITLLITLLNILFSFKFQILLDSIISYQSKGNFLYYILFFSVLIALKGWLELLRNLLFHLFNHLLDHRLILDIYHRIFSLPYLYYKNHTTGEIVSRVQDLGKVKEFISNFFVSCLVDLTLFIITYTVLWNLNSQITFWIAFVVLVMMIIVWLSRKLMMSLLQKLKEKNSIVNSYLIETITGIETVKNLQIEHYIWEQFAQKYQKYNCLSYKIGVRFSKLEAFRDIIYQYGTFLCLVLGGWLILKSKITLGVFMTYYFLLPYLLDPIHNLLNIAFSYQEAKIAFDRVKDLYSLEKIPLKGKLEVDQIKGKIEIHNINYQYRSNIPILDSVEIMINPKDRVLIYGKSGSGKSTLAKMINGILESDQGKIVLDDHDIREYSRKLLGDKICYLSQNEFLFQDSVYHNIYLNSKQSYQKFLETNKLCLVEEIVAKHPLKYQMLLEENGFNISGGERQRILLARAILRDADLYIFDESLNEIDIDRERTILNNLFKKFPNKTFIVISHRYHNNDLFNRKFEMKEGKCYEVLG